MIAGSASPKRTPGTDARNLLLIGRISEQPGFDGVGANWYYDGIWKTPWASAVYLAKTNDVDFVRTYFDDNQTQWGPSRSPNNPSGHRTRGASISPNRMVTCLPLATKLTAPRTQPPPFAG